MRLSHILTESQKEELVSLQEGPFLNKVGTAIGKGVGTAAKAAGAVAGGIAGIGKAVKKGYQAGKATVSGGGDDTAGPAGKPTPQQPSGQGTNTATQPTPQSQGATQKSDNPTANSKPTTSSADFDPEFGVPITPAGVASYAKHGAKNNAKKADAAVAAGWTHDDQTGIWSPPATQPAATKPRTRNTEYARIQKSIDQLTDPQRSEIIKMIRSDPKVISATKKVSASPVSTEPVQNTSTDDSAGADDAESGAALLKSLGSKMYKRATGYAAPGQEDPEKTQSGLPLTDRSGEIPRDILNTINQMSVADRKLLASLL